jgi:carbamate kinase
MIAMGGNSISPKNGSGEIEEQFERTRQALDGIAHFIDLGYNLCINHGNGPQVGNEIMRMELTQDSVPTLPLGICVASTQGSIGYMIQQCLQNKLREMEIDREVVTLVSQVIVDKNDDSFKNPTKYIGKRYTKKGAEEMTSKRGWDLKEQENGKFRRVVPSPMPEYIMHGRSIKALVDRGTIVIASGGGGIPVHNNEIGQLDGLDAVIDKDYSAAKMGRIIRAQELWIITDVECVYDNFGNTNQKRISSITRKEAQEFHKKDVFQEGSIAPKIKAAIHFLKHHGDRVIITSIPHIKDALNGSAGTEIRNEA